MLPSSPRVVTVRHGRVRPVGSWLYVWIDVDSSAIVHVGGTGHDPELRSYLHVESEDPRLGGVRATVPRFAERDFDVLAFELPDDVERAAAKQALIAHLAEGGAMSTLPGLTEPIVRAIEIHRGRAG